MQADKDGNSPLQSACLSSNSFGDRLNSEMLQLLLQNADMTAKNNLGETAFLTCAANESDPGDFETVLAALIRRGSNLQTTNAIGRNALHLRVLQQKPAFLRTLVNLGVNTQAKDQGGKSPLQLAETGYPLAAYALSHLETFRKDVSYPKIEVEKFEAREGGLSIAALPSGEMWKVGHGDYSDYRGGYEISRYDKSGGLVMKRPVSSTWPKAVDESIGTIASTATDHLIVAAMSERTIRNPDRSETRHRELNIDSFAPDGMLRFRSTFEMESNESCYKLSVKELKNGDITVACTLGTGYGATSFAFFRVDKNGAVLNKFRLDPTQSEISRPGELITFVNSSDHVVMAWSDDGKSVIQVTDFKGAVLSKTDLIESELSRLVENKNGGYRAYSASSSQFMLLDAQGAISNKIDQERAFNADEEFLNSGRFAKKWSNSSSGVARSKVCLNGLDFSQSWCKNFDFYIDAVDESITGSIFAIGRFGNGKSVQELKARDGELIRTF